MKILNKFVAINLFIMPPLLSNAMANDWNKINFILV